MFLDQGYTLCSVFNYSFTAFSYETLESIGFQLSKESNFEKDGVITQILNVPSPYQTKIDIEFREIIDEDLFQARARLNSNGARDRDLLQPGITLWGDRDEIFNLGTIPIEVKKRMINLPKRAENSFQIFHTNTVSEVYGLYIHLSSSNIERAERHLGPRTSSGNWVLSDGCPIYLAEKGDGLFDFMMSRKDFDFWALMLKCKDSDSFRKVSQIEERLNWKKLALAPIKESMTDWDLLVVCEN